MKASKSTGTAKQTAGKQERLRRSPTVRVLVVDQPSQVIRARARAIASSIDGALKRLASK